MGFFDTLVLPQDRIAVRFIRLELHSGSVNSLGNELRGIVEVSALDEAPEYEALSYVWGGEERRVEIQLNGQPFSIAPNLHEALRQFSLDRNDADVSYKRLWVDAICINQTDDAEKSTQVMQMAKIYAKAKRVLMWLGEADNSSELAFDTLRRFAVNDGTTDGQATSAALYPGRQERRHAIDQLAKRAYFGRVWVIQEAVAARVAIVVCGSESMDLDTFSRAFSRVTGSGFYPYSESGAVNVTGLGKWRKCFLRTPPSQERDAALEIQTLLMYSRDKECKNDRDKVYALRGISTQRFADGVIVDYAKSPEQVYIDCAKHWLTIRADLRVLSTIEPQHLRKSSLKLPSWVPDWSQSNHHSGVMQRYFRFVPEKFFCTAGRTTPKLAFYDNPDTLSLEGLHFDSVAKVVKVKPSLHTAIEDSAKSLVLKSFESFALEVSSAMTYTHTGEAFDRALLRTVTGDRTGLSSRVADEFRAKYLTRYSTYRLDRIASLDDLPLIAWRELTMTVNQVLHDKDIFVTAKGYIGIARSGIEVGDMACIFSGGEVPFLVRLLDKSQKEFRLVTESYIHGIMDGEAASSLEGPGRQPFRLI